MILKAFNKDGDLIATRRSTGEENDKHWKKNISEITPVIITHTTKNQEGNPLIWTTKIIKLEEWREGKCTNYSTNQK